MAETNAAPDPDLISAAKVWDVMANHVATCSSSHKHEREIDQRDCFTVALYAVLFAARDASALAPKKTAAQRKAAAEAMGEGEVSL